MRKKALSCVRGNGTKADYCRLRCLLMVFSLLWALPGCGNSASNPDFPPAEETVRNAAEDLGWTFDVEGTQSWADNQILYAFETENQANASVSCAMADGKRVLTEIYVVMQLPGKPQFAWEDYEKAVTLAEALYGGFAEGELYQALSAQDMPQPNIPEAGADTPTSLESLSWKVELPAGYAAVRWSISGGTVEHNFPSPVIKDWRIILSISLYESKADYESMLSNASSSK